MTELSPTAVGATGGAGNPTVGAVLALALSFHSLMEGVALGLV